jgi:ADP-ribose pyrophosphatase YjhB (NUDIX family)
MVQFETSEVILSKINELKTKGYDRIHLPGGTSLDGSHYVGIIVYSYDTVTKQMYFLGVPYNSNFHLNGRSGHNKRAGETKEQTIVRELFEETGFQANPENLNLIWEKKIPDNRPGKVAQIHSKYIYLISEQDCTGELFKFSGPNLMDAETASPMWIPANLFIQNFFKGHLEAINEAINILSSQDRNYAYALMNLF